MLIKKNLEIQLGCSHLKNPNSNLTHLNPQLLPMNHMIYKKSTDKCKTPKAISVTQHHQQNSKPH